MAPGAVAGDVYAAWQSRVDEAGLAHYRRHHCGYTLGIGFPPSWVGGSRVVGLRHDSHMQLRAGMVFHVMSWLMGTHRGDYFISDTAVVTETGAEVLTSVPRRPHVV
jgi:Xaa-Pro dipeptidase